MPRDASLTPAVLPRLHRAEPGGSPAPAQGLLHRGDHSQPCPRPCHRQGTAMQGSCSPRRQGKPPSAALSQPYPSHPHQAPMSALLCLCPPWSLAAAPARDTVEHRAHHQEPCLGCPRGAEEADGSFWEAAPGPGQATWRRRTLWAAAWLRLPVQPPSIRGLQTPPWPGLTPSHHAVSCIPLHRGPCPGPQPTASPVPRHPLRHAETAALLAPQPSCPHCGWTHGTSQPPGPPRCLALILL